MAADAAEEGRKKCPPAVRHGRHVGEWSKVPSDDDVVRYVEETLCYTRKDDAESRARVLAAGAFLWRMHNIYDVHPNAVRDLARLFENFATYVPTVQPPSTATRFDDLLGVDRAAEQLRAAATTKLYFPAMQYRPLTTVLLYGPPGTGKTELVNALYNEYAPVSGAGATSVGRTTERRVVLLSLKASEMLSTWSGGSVRNATVLFRTAALLARTIVHPKNLHEDGRHGGPLVIVFVDEIDLLVPSRDLGGGGGGGGGGGSGAEGGGAVLSEMLVRIGALASSPARSLHVLRLIDEPYHRDSVEGDILFVAATNNPSAIDAALLNRVQTRIFVGLPDMHARRVLVAHEMLHYTLMNSLLRVAGTAGTSWLRLQDAQGRAVRAEPPWLRAATSDAPDALVTAQRLRLSPASSERVLHALATLSGTTGVRVGRANTLVLGGLTLFVDGRYVPDAELAFTVAPSASWATWEAYARTLEELAVAVARHTGPSPAAYRYIGAMRSRTDDIARMARYFVDRLERRAVTAAGAETDYARVFYPASASGAAAAAYSEADGDRTLTTHGVSFRTLLDMLAAGFAANVAAILSPASRLVYAPDEQRRLMPPLHDVQSVGGGGGGGGAAVAEERRGPAELLRALTSLRLQGLQRDVNANIELLRSYRAKLVDARAFLDTARLSASGGGVDEAYAVVVYFARAGRALPVDMYRQFTDALASATTDAYAVPGTPASTAGTVDLRPQQKRRATSPPDDSSGGGSGGGGGGGATSFGFLDGTSA